MTTTERARLKVLMVTPHLPPHQAANALLPHLLGKSLAARGHQARFLTFGRGGAEGGVAYVRRRRGPRAIRLPQALEALETWWKGRRLVDEADLVHIHSNTWMNQVAARLSRRRGKPYLLTHYGTEIWHHDGKDALFRELNRGARHVTFYSRALLHRAEELLVPLRQASVVYPPVADTFLPLASAERTAKRQALLAGGDLLLVNVKRLHPLADQATLIRAMATVVAARPGARLLIAGTGELESALKSSAAALGLQSAVRFLGLVPNDQVAELVAAADLFVLPSRLEATPTVALEALACGTPVLSADNPGGQELQGLFGDDVRLTAGGDADALAAAVLAFAAAPRRTRPQTAERIAAGFRLDGVVDRYLEMYREAVAS